MAGAKRGATSDINHDNWDQEDEKEEPGVFKLAPPEVIQRRVIKRAVRRKPAVANSNKPEDEIKSNVFGNLNMNAFANPGTESKPVTNAFDFLSVSKVSTELPVNQKNVAADNKMTRNAFANAPFGHVNPETTPAVMVSSFDFLSGDKERNDSTTKQSTDTNSMHGSLCPGLGTGSLPMDEKANLIEQVESQELKKESVEGNPSSVDQNAPAFSSPSSLRDFVEPTFRKYSHLIAKPAIESEKNSEGNKSGRSEEFLKNMTEINASFAGWIQKNLEEDPTSILTRCFKDYIRHVQGLFDEEKKGDLTESQLEVLRKQEQVLNEVVTRDP